MLLLLGQVSESSPFDSPMYMSYALKQATLDKADSRYMCTLPRQQGGGGASDHSLFNYLSPSLHKYTRHIAPDDRSLVRGPGHS